jgi:hypothetical protein
MGLLSQGKAANNLLEKTLNSPDTKAQFQSARDQTTEMQNLKDEEAVQKRQIEAKQVRMLRNNYSGRGLGIMSAPGGQLGDQSGLNNKLGA